VDPVDQSGHRVLFDPVGLDNLALLR